jgi:uncharacterized glyoxalase superfamily protein PhnB
MTTTPDAWSTLATPIIPIAPSPSFAVRLRAQVVRALNQPEGDDMTVTTDTNRTDDPPSPPRPAAIPYLSVQGAREAIAWYGRVFGAELVGDPIVMPDDRIGHSELEIDGGVVYLSDAHPEIGVVAPTPGQTAVSLMLRVEDVDATIRTVVAEGGRLDREPYDAYGQRNAWVFDAFGHRWGLSGPVHP